MKGKPFRHDDISVHGDLGLGVYVYTCVIELHAWPLSAKIFVRNFRRPEAEDTEGKK